MAAIFAIEAIAAEGKGNLFRRGTRLNLVSSCIPKEGERNDANNH
jgi:hypothetical protein